MRDGILIAFLHFGNYPHRAQRLVESDEVDVIRGQNLHDDVDGEMSSKCQAIFLAHIIRFPDQ